MVGRKAVYPHHAAHLPNGHPMRGSLAGRHLPPVKVVRRPAGRARVAVRPGTGAKRKRAAAGTAAVPAVGGAGTAAAVPAVGGAGTAAVPAVGGAGTAAVAAEEAADRSSASGSEEEASEYSDAEVEPAEEARLLRRETERAQHQQQQPRAGAAAVDRNLAPPPARRSRAELLSACNEPAPNLAPVVEPWRLTLQDPPGVAFPLYELDSFDPVNGINYDGMHTIYGVMRDTIVRYVQSMRKRSKGMIEYDNKNDILVVGGRGECWVYMGWVRVRRQPTCCALDCPCLTAALSIP